MADASASQTPGPPADKEEIVRNENRTSNNVQSSEQHQTVAKPVKTEQGPQDEFTKSTFTSAQKLLREQRYAPALVKVEVDVDRKHFQVASGKVSPRKSRIKGQDY